MIQPRQKTSWMKLSSWLFHLVKSTIVVVNVSISTSAVWLVDDASITHHFYAIEVFCMRGFGGECLLRDVIESFGVTEHFYYYFVKRSNNLLNEIK